jgi:hypothetical protein
MAERLGLWRPKQIVLSKKLSINDTKVTAIRMIRTDRG